MSNFTIIGCANSATANINTIPTATVSGFEGNTEVFTPLPIIGVGLTSSIIGGGPPKYVIF